ncbi:MAG: CRISPR-associated helicase Cas3' [Balneolaceae bacterium]|nr:CRISPR-associated helicase Cas3' [Balneolaceae bacterium]
MKYFSHSKKLDEGTVRGSKLLVDHINGVGEIAQNQFNSSVRFNYSDTELRKLLKDIVGFHDLGKYTSYFQNYLLQVEPIDSKLKQHARFGGYATYHKLQEDEKKALIALVLIFSHHGNLISFDNYSGLLETNAEKVFEEQKKNIQGKLDEIEEELEISNLSDILSFPGSKQIRKAFKIWVKKKQNVEDYFLINYLFSLLIEADKLDASETPLYSLKPIKEDWVDKRFSTPDLSGLENLTGLTNNELRNFCRAEVVSHLKKEGILKQRIFTLTAPTGIGKTMTALDFSLKLKSKIREKENYAPQIIYALPFINIIEQALKEYENTLPKDEIRILGHYQFADVFGIQSDSDEEKYHQKLMKLDTWQGDVIITSFVQFFETLISNRNKLLKKFNHFAGSIIILDEVQTLRLDQIPLLGAVLFYLSKFLDARIILMTATKPKIFELAEQEILKVEGEQVQPLELLTSHEKVFSLFERTSIHPLLNELQEEKGDRSKEFVEEVFSTRWKPKQSCIVVCNTVNRSIQLRNEIDGFLENKGLENPVFYLSTNIIPAHRLERIQKIKSAINNGDTPILVATQVVEAGVDLDFNMGFRDLGPIDSIIQVAGRINRSNERKQQNEPLYIIDFGECQKIYGQLTYQQSKKALEGKKVITESNYLQLINEYFDNISDKSSFRDSRKYFKSLKALNYDCDNPKRNYAISSFRIIEESDRYRPVFIETDDKSEFLKEKYLQKIIGEIDKETFDKKYKLDFQQHIISVPTYLTQDLATINEYEENILIVPEDLLDIYYNFETGFIRSQETESVLMF